MKTNEWWRTLQITFAYIGTVVGAGFATGQEILQFFTQFGWVASLTMLLATLLFVLCGARLMLLSRKIRAKSYEDLNVYLFGRRLGQAMSLFTLVILLAVTGVMLAGSGAIFEEHLQWSYQIGLLLTLTLTFFVLKKGMDAIISINSFVVPLMLLFGIIIVVTTIDAPLTGRWLSISSDHSLGIAWLAPLLYVSFNLWMAQAVLVPLGANIKKRRTIIMGSVGGGLGIGLLIWIAHFAMSPLMPGVRQFDIPMAQVIDNHGWLVQMLFLFILFAEIFTTLIANVYGLSLQLQNRLRLRQQTIILLILLACYVMSQFGFKELLSFLYPLFGLLGLVWFAKLMWKIPDSQHQNEGQ
jgi:uncharacterized membrane protein YkvI